MPPLTPSLSTPTSLPNSPEALSAKLQQAALLRGVRDGLLKERVPQATVDKVVGAQQQQQQQQAAQSPYAFYGYVINITTGPADLLSATAPDTTWVHIQQVAWGTITAQVSFPPFQFPPNDAKFLAELVRAQIYQLLVYISMRTSFVPGQQDPAMIEYMWVTQVRPFPV